MRRKRRLTGCCWRCSTPSKGDDVAALEAFRKALEHDPGSAATWYHKALVEARTLDFDTAIADLKKAREKSPNEKLAVQIDKQLGKLYARNRQTAEALKVWQTLLAANPKDEELNEDLVELHIEEGLFKEAAGLEEKLVEQTKDQYLAVTRKLRLGDIYHRAGDRAKAVGRLYVGARYGGRRLLAGARDSGAARPSVSS